MNCKNPIIGLTILIAFCVIVLATTSTFSGGDLTIVGNFSGNQYYAGMWNYSANSTAWTFALTEDVYMNLTGLTEGDNNGFDFTCNSSATGGCYFTALKSGIYQVGFSISFVPSGGGALISIAAVHDFDVNTHRDCYARRDATVNKVGSASISCLMDVDVGDKINIQIENEDNGNDILVHTVNFNLVRIGD